MRKKKFSHKKICKTLWLIIFPFILSCSRNTQNDSLLIAVSIPPQAWFVSQIAGGNAEHPAETVILVPPGQNPHNYEPAPRQIQSLSNADVWILSGAEFEITLRPKIESLFPNLLIIDGTQGVQFRLLEEHDHDEHDPNENFSLPIPNSLLSAPYIDKHTWLGRFPAKILAGHIKDSLCVLDNENEKKYQSLYEKLVMEIDNVFDELQITLAPLNGKNVFVYHPSFGYFLDEFGIHQEAVETGGKEPTPRQLNNLLEKINHEKPSAIFVQAQFPVSAAKTLADAAGAQVIELDPLAEDWLENIKFMGQILKNIIQ
ncbi:MAG: zinc ABC transporter substrate-binding protein [Treponema sp.]|nr:zinc ABC transporter substrate-binding protein [Treponema sp.]